jgi:hypothetical protein
VKFVHVEVGIDPAERSHGEDWELWYLSWEPYGACRLMPPFEQYRFCSAFGTARSGWCASMARILRGL